MKAKTISKLKKEVQEVMSRYVRLRDSLKTTGDPNFCRCITCSVFKPRTEMQAGHFIDSRHSATRFVEENVHSQCPRCNVYLDGNILEYRRQIIKLYGEGYDVLLEDKAMETKKFSVQELMGLKQLYSNKIKELEGK